MHPRTLPTTATHREPHRASGRYAAPASVGYTCATSNACGITCCTSSFAVSRLTASGAPDSTFDADGKLTTSFTGYTNDQINAVAILDDGKFLAVGQANSGGNNDFALAKYNAPAGLEERVYVIEDANYNVTSITDVFGGVIEHYLYDAYGKRTITDSSHTVRGSSSYAFDYGFQGGQYVANAELMLFRHRFLSTSLQRWMQVDPMGYPDGINTYLFEIAAPNEGLDAEGLRRARFEFDAFIRGSARNAWQWEPSTWSGGVVSAIHSNSFQFATDRRTFGLFNVNHNDANARIYHFGTIETNGLEPEQGEGSDTDGPTAFRDQTHIGDSDGIELWIGAGYSHRRENIGTNASPQWKVWPRKRTQVHGIYYIKTSPANGDVEVHVDNGGNYPHVSLSPDIDYSVSFKFHCAGNGTVQVTISGKHNQFPDYEAMLDNKLVYKYRTPWSDPSYITLGLSHTFKKVVTRFSNGRSYGPGKTW